MKGLPVVVAFLLGSCATDELARPVEAASQEECAIFAAVAASEGLGSFPVHRQTSRWGLERPRDFERGPQVAVDLLELERVRRGGIQVSLDCPWAELGVRRPRWAGRYSNRSLAFSRPVSVSVEGGEWASVDAIRYVGTGQYLSRYLLERRAGGWQVVEATSAMFHLESIM